MLASMVCVAAKFCFFEGLNTAVSVRFFQDVMATCHPPCPFGSLSRGCSSLFLSLVFGVPPSRPERRTILPARRGWQPQLPYVLPVVVLHFLTDAKPPGLH